MSQQNYQLLFLLNLSTGLLFFLFYFLSRFRDVLVQVLSQNLNQERRKSDQLLRNVLPKSIALELTQTERVQPIDYESASVLFTDFVSFTQIAENFTLAVKSFRTTFGATQ